MSLTDSLRCSYQFASLEDIFLTHIQFLVILLITASSYHLTSILNLILHLPIIYLSSIIPHLSSVNGDQNEKWYKWKVVTSGKYEKGSKWKKSKLIGVKMKSGDKLSKWKVVKMKSSQKEKWSKIKVVKMKCGWNEKWWQVVKINSYQNLNWSKWKVSKLKVS